MVKKVEREELLGGSVCGENFVSGFVIVCGGVVFWENLCCGFVVCLERFL